MKTIAHSFIVLANVLTFEAGNFVPRSVEVFSVAGYRQSVSWNGAQSLDVHALPSGIYVLVIRGTKNENKSVKFTVLR